MPLEANLKNVSWRLLAHHALPSVRSRLWLCGHLTTLSSLPCLRCLEDTNEWGERSSPHLVINVVIDVVIDVVSCGVKRCEGGGASRIGVPKL
jgi:hypothetical protein